MSAVIWIIINAAAFVIYAGAGIHLLARINDLPTMDVLRACPDSVKTDVEPVRRFRKAAGIASVSAAAKASFISFSVFLYSRNFSAVSAMSACSLAHCVHFSGWEMTAGSAISADNLLYFSKMSSNFLIIIT